LQSRPNKQGFKQKKKRWNVLLLSKRKLNLLLRLILHVFKRRKTRKSCFLRKRPKQSACAKLKRLRQLRIWRIRPNKQGFKLKKTIKPRFRRRANALLSSKRKPNLMLLKK